jgi:hypothetical protein
MGIGKPTGSGYIGNGLEIRRLCVNGSISQSQLNFWDSGLYINTVDYSAAGQNTEGLLIQQLYMVPVRFGIKAIGNGTYTGIAGTDWAGRPIAGRIALLTLTNSHIDARNSGNAILLRNVQGHYISQNFLISDGTANVIRAENAHEGSFLGNTLFNAGTGASIYIGGHTGSANIVSTNVFRGGSTHVYMESSSMYNKVYGNVGDSFLQITVTDLGTSNSTGSVGL